jgi:hypothetical protein
MAVQRRHRAPLAPVACGSLRAATSVAITMAVCTPSGVANTAATVIATAQEPPAKWQQAATTAPIAVRHWPPGRLGRGGVVARHRRRAARQQIIHLRRRGTVMRHYFSLPPLIRHSNGDAVGIFRQLRPIPGHPGGMLPATPRASLPALARCVQRLTARLCGAIAVAVDLPAIAAAAHDDPAAAPHAHVQTARPRSDLPVIADAA